MNNLIFVVCALACGVVSTAQIATNKQLGQHLHNFYIPAAANMLIGVVATVALTVMMTKEYPSGEVIHTSPWFLWLAGGVLGVAFITGTILLAPKLGAATLIGLVVTGQFLFSVVVDKYGWFGFEQHDANWPRVAGCLLLIGGVALISKF